MNDAVCEVMTATLAVVRAVFARGADVARSRPRAAGCVVLAIGACSVVMSPNSSLPIDAGLFGLLIPGKPALTVHWPSGLLA